MVATHIWVKTTNGTLGVKITPATKGIVKSYPKNMGVLLYYSRSVDPTILVALRSISVKQSNINKTTAQSIKKLLD